MEDYVKPTMRKMPFHIILHVGTNDVPTKKANEQIADNIVNSVTKLKSNCDISISGITARIDQYKKKAADVNQELKKKCGKKLQFLDCGNTLTVRHLNPSKLHLDKGSTQVLSNLSNLISNITN